MPASDYDEGHPQRRMSSAAVNDVGEIARRREHVSADVGDDDDYDPTPPVEGMFDQLAKLQSVTWDLVNQLTERLGPYLVPSPDGEGDGGVKDDGARHSTIYEVVSTRADLQRRLNNELMVLIRRVER